MKRQQTLVSAGNRIRCAILLRGREHWVLSNEVFQGILIDASEWAPVEGTQRRMGEKRHREYDEHQLQALVRDQVGRELLAPLPRRLQRRVSQLVVYLPIMQEPGHALEFIGI